MSAVAKPLPTRLDIDEFLAWDGDGTGRKFMLVDGVPQAMAPPSHTHGILQATIARLLGNHLADKGGACHVAADPGIIPRVRSRSNFRIPDLAVSCTPDDPSERAMPDPVLVVEILSPSNEAETRESVWAYSTIPSVREILVVHSVRIGAELLRRADDGSWPDGPEIVNADVMLDLRSIGFSTPLVELYQQTHLVRSRKG